MNVFDFDNTLYRGESSVDFALFMIRHNRRLIRWLPTIFWNLLKYKLCMVDQASVEKPLNGFLKAVIRDKQELLTMTERFWLTHRHKLNRNLIRRIAPGDAVITAGPSFLLEPVRHDLKDVRMICSEVDLDKKKAVFLNFRENKVKQYRAVFGDTVIDRFYTDSFNDQAMMDISGTVWMVKKGRIRRIK